MGKAKWGIWLGGAGLAVLAGLFPLLYFLPEFVEGFLKSRAEGVGLKDTRLTVSSVSLLGLELSRFAIGPEESPPLEIAYLEVSYDLVSLQEQRLKGVTFTGLKARLHWDGEKIAVAGLDDLAKTGGGEGDGLAGVANLLRQVGKVELNASILILKTPEREISLPVEGWVRAESGSLCRFALETVAQGAKIGIAGTMDFATGEGKGEVTASDVQFGSMGEIKNIPGVFINAPSLSIKGNYHLHKGIGSFEASLPDFQLKTFSPASGALQTPHVAAKGNLRALASFEKERMKQTDLSLQLEDFRLEQGAYALAGRGEIGMVIPEDYRPQDIQARLTLSNLSLPEGSLAFPAEMTLTGATMQDMAFSLSAFQLPEPYPLAVSRLSGHISNILDGPEVGVSFAASVGSELLASLLPEGEIKMKSPYGLRGDLVFHSAPDGWRWKAHASGDQGCGLAFGKRELTIGKAGLALALEGTLNRAAGQVDLSLGQVTSKGEAEALTARKIAVKNRLNFSLDDGLRMESDVSLRGADLSLAHLAKMEGMDLDWSLEFPVAKGGKKGKYAIRSIKAKDQALRDIRGTLEQKIPESTTAASGSQKIVDSLRNPRHLFGFSGEALFPLGPKAGEGIPLRFAGDGEWSPGNQGLNLHLELPKKSFPQPTALGPLHPSLQDWKFQGGIAAAGDVSYHNGNLKGGGKLTLEEGELQSERPKVVVTGINSSLAFENLLPLTTLPDQRLLFKKMTWGEIPFTDGELHFRMEGTRSFFLENGEFVWCEGRVFANAVRFDLDKDDFTLLLYCDKVNLSRMLNFMVQDISAEGKGGISGIIPLQISKGKVTFKEGFLYSTPGDTGMIKIKETDVISGGNILLEEAIKDFSYDWVKVRLDSRGENLNMVVNLNGTPNRKLPLALDPRTKSFTRDEKGDAGVNLQGLHLELRFNEIPLDELLRKGKYLKGLLQ